MGKRSVTGKKNLFLLLFLCFFVLLLGIYPAYQKVKTAHYGIVIYGGGFAGCAAAYCAASLAPEQKVLLIVPEPVPVLGGLGTVGGQNFADIRYWQGQLVTAGSFLRWFGQSGQFYHTGEMAELLRSDLSQFPNLTILYQHDLKKAYQWQNRVRVLNMAPVGRDDDGVVRWRKGRKIVWGNVFLDASDEGRLVRMTGNNTVVGRQDWPKDYLSSGEDAQWARQQAATLMFLVRGVKTPEVAGQYGDIYFAIDAQGSKALVGGQETWQKNPQIRQFNEQYQAKGFAVKPINAAQNGKDSDEWWVNMLLVFDVDGRAQEKDRGDEVFSEVRLNQKTVDQAWLEAGEVLAQPEFLQALQCFTVNVKGGEYGFGEAELVRDGQNRPVVGEILYLRETVHGVEGKQTDIRQKNQTSDPVWRFALTTEEAQKAGDGKRKDYAADYGADEEHYAERIGLGYYLMDINAYLPEDLEQDGRYVWPVTGFLRPDWQNAGGQPINPVYLPYAALIPSKCVNLLVPGYAASCSSLAWSEIRVLPNLAVLGDAAGIAAVRAVLFNETPAFFGPEQLDWVQEQLRKNGARLDK